MEVGIYHAKQTHRKNRINWKHQDIESGPTEEAKREILKKISYLPNTESLKVLIIAVGFEAVQLTANQ